MENDSIVRFCLTINDVINEYQNLSDADIANEIKNMMHGFYLSERISEGGETIGFRKNTHRILNILKLIA